MALIGPGQAPQAKRGFGGTLKDIFLGKEGQYNQVTNYDPQQLRQFQQVGQMGMQNQQDPYAGFDPIAQNATRRFQSETIPGLAERFTSMGGSDTRGSSDFAGMLGGAGADLQSQLADLRAKYGQEQQKFGLEQLKLGQTQQYDNEYQPGTEGLLSKIPGFLAEAGLNYATGGLTGAAAGGNLIGQGVDALKGKFGGGEVSPTMQQARQKISGMSTKAKRNMLNRLRSQQGARSMQPQMNQAQSNLSQKFPGLAELDLGDTQMGAAQNNYWSPVPSWLQVNR